MSPRKTCRTFQLKFFFFRSAAFFPPCLSKVTTSVQSWFCDPANRPQSLGEVRGDRGESMSTIGWVSRRSVASGLSVLAHQAMRWPVGGVTGVSVEVSCDLQCESKSLPVSMEIWIVTSRHFHDLSFTFAVYYSLELCPLQNMLLANVIWARNITEEWKQQQQQIWICFCTHESISIMWIGSMPLRVCSGSIAKRSLCPWALGESHNFHSWKK